MIGQRLSEMDLVGHLGTYLEELKLSDILGQAGLQRILCIIEYLESPEQRRATETMLRKALPKTFTRIYAVMNRLGADTPERADSGQSPQAPARAAKRSRAGSHR